MLNSLGPRYEDIVWEMEHIANRKPVVSSATNEPGGGRAQSDASADPIAAGLRRLLASVSEEPVPDEFMRLLDELDSKRSGKPATE